LLVQATNISAALSEAQQAESLAPESARVNLIMGQALDANGRPEDAAPYYQNALTLAKSVEPKFQISSVANLEKRLQAKRR
jgi:Flp pilus assembly protein TadD